MGQADEWRTAGSGRRRGLEVFVTPDQNIRYQQNLAHRQIAIVVLTQAQWPYVRRYLSEIAEAVNAAACGSYVEIEISASGPTS
jgi:hypothetical protein